MSEINDLLILLQDKNNLDNPNWLSIAAVKLATLLYLHNTEMSQAELEETQVAVSYLDPLVDGKKMSATEAEKRALVDTHNKYRTMRFQGEAVIEAVNSIKKRLDLLAWEHKTSVN